MSANLGNAPVDIVARIAGCAPAMRPAERDVAEMILGDIASAAHANIGELAERACVSIASVTRFAKTVGCKDVRELKLRLAQEAAVGGCLRCRPSSACADRRASHAAISQPCEPLPGQALDDSLLPSRRRLREARWVEAASLLGRAQTIYVSELDAVSKGLADDVRDRLAVSGRPVAPHDDGASPVAAVVVIVLR